MNEATAEQRFQRVAVLKGGPSAERDVSLASGAAVARGLREAGYQVTEIDVTGHEVTIPEGTQAVFIALHGAFGEDGEVQALLTERGMPFTGSGVESNRLSFDKCLTKRIFAEHGIPTPGYEVLRRDQPRKLPLPVVVKPPTQGSTIGIHRVFDEAAWPAAIEDALRYGEEVLVEEYVEGRELTVGILREEVLPIVEIEAPDGYYNYEAKYTKGQSRYHVPAALDPDQESRCNLVSVRAYRALHCAGMARVDLRLTPEGEPTVLEVNSIPGFTETSLLPMAARAAGYSFPRLCGHIMESARVD